MWRLDFVVLLVRMWRLKALALTIFPVPVILKRLAAPRCVLSLGIFVLFLYTSRCAAVGRRCIGNGGADVIVATLEELPSLLERDFDAAELLGESPAGPPPSPPS